MLKFLVRTTYKSYLVSIKSPNGLEENLQEIAKPHEGSRLLLLRCTDITNKVKFPYGQFIRNLINYLGANMLIYYYPKTLTLLIMDESSLATQTLSIGRNQYWLERFSLDTPELTVDII